MLDLNYAMLPYAVLSAWFALAYMGVTIQMILEAPEIDEKDEL